MFFALAIMFYMSLFYEQNIVEEELTTETFKIVGFDFGN